MLLSFTLFGSSLILGIVLAVLFIAFILSDLNESGTSATVCAALFIGVNHFWGNIPIFTLATLNYIGMYILIGFIFALVRTYFKGRELSDEKKQFYDLRDSVLRWWFLFPFSMLNWIFGKLLVNLWNLLYDLTEKIFIKLFNAHTPKDVIEK